MRKEFNNLSAGIVRDVAPSELPDNVWSNGKNVRFISSGVEKIPGDVNWFGAVNPGTIPYFAQPYRVGAQILWAIYGQNEIIRQRLVDSVDISRTGGYSTNISHGWTGGTLKGVALVTNGVDPPQSWVPEQTLGTLFHDMTYDVSSGQSWADAGVGANIMRVHGNFAVAMDTTQNAIRNRFRVWWSHPPDEIYEEPPTWDYSKPEFDAGFVDLDDTDTPIVDGSSLRDDFLIYKEDSVYRMTYVQTNNIFNFRKIFSSFGALSRHCIKAFYGKHAVLTADDLIIHDGTNVTSLFKDRLVKWYVSILDPTNYERSFVGINPPRKEIWACIPTIGNDWPNLAIIWSWDNNTISYRDIGKATYMEFGFIDADSYTPSFFDTLTGSFDSDSGTFDEEVSRRRKTYLFTQTQKMLALDEGTTFKETGKMSAYVERTGLRLGERASYKYVYVRAVMPRIEGTFGTKVDVYVGSQNSIGGPVSYKKYVYTIGDDRVDTRVTGRYIAIRFGTEDVNYQWRLNGYDIEYEYIGDTTYSGR